jgi:hypothetical protein
MRTEVLAPNADQLAVGLVGDAVDLLKVIRVRDDLVIGEDILKVIVRTTWLLQHLLRIAVSEDIGGVVARVGAWGTYLEDNHGVYGSDPFV